MKNYPDVWREVLNTVKDGVRADMIINDPFLSSSKTRAMVTKRFHEVLATKQSENIVPEPGEFILTDTSITHLPIQCRILVGCPHVTHCKCVPLSWIHILIHFILAGDQSFHHPK